MSSIILLVLLVVSASATWQCLRWYQRRYDTFTAEKVNEYNAVYMGDEDNHPWTLTELETFRINWWADTFSQLVTDTIPFWFCAIITSAFAGAFVTSLVFNF